MKELTSKEHKETLIKLYKTTNSTMLKAYRKTLITNDMKKVFCIFLSLIAIFTLFLLGACGKQSVQKSYLQGINQEKKTDVRITIEHKGDKAISNQTITTVYYKEAGVTKDQLKEIIDKYDEDYKDVKGFTHSAEYKDDYMVEKTTLNYEKADLDQLIEKKLVTTQKDKKVDYISFKSTFDMMKQGGFKEVKNGKFEELK